MKHGTFENLFSVLSREAGHFYDGVGELDVTPAVAPAEIRHHLQTRFDFDSPLPAEKLISEVASVLNRWTLHVTHPRYFGLFMALAERGIDGYQELIEHQAEMADLLREELTASGWRVVNDTPLPVVCFLHPSIEHGKISTSEVVHRLNRRGSCWISEVYLSGGVKALRACITSYRTESSDIDVLLDEIEAVLA